MTIPIPIEKSDRANHEGLENMGTANHLRSPFLFESLNPAELYLRCEIEQDDSGR
jgi:hypothetical protein